MSSSLKKSLSSMKKLSSNDIKNTMTTTIMISIIYNICVLIYVLNLENEECKCFRDWRHEFIKYYSFGLIVWGMFSLAFNLYESKNEIINIAKKLAMVAYFINVWSVYSYVGILDYTQCKCAIQQTKKTHYFLYLFRYILVAFVFLGLLGGIVMALE
jgi:hypothetical protein